MKAFILAVLTFFAGAACAAEVAGVKLDDKTRVGSSDLVLNGAGLRKRVFFQVYAIGLYLPQKSSSAGAAIDQPGAKRVAIHMLRDVGADDFSESSLKPPLPMMSRTPYCCISGRVKRSMRSLVVVPTQIAS